MGAPEQAPPDGVHHYSSADEVPFQISKYWHQRHNIFPKYDDGIWMTDDAWFGVTPEPVAEKIAEHIATAPKSKTILIDAFAGAGGNTIAFAKSGRWNQIFAFEKDPKVLACAKHNAQVYGVEKKIMDYSLLVGIHDMQRGNEDNLRDKTLQVFQPGGDKPEEAPMLTRTPSKLEHARRVRELRETIKKERPTPMEAATDIMPDEANRKGFFYKDDGGFRATNQDDTASNKIYYLGIIDCLTRYNIVKKMEHMWKGMGGDEPNISPIPPVRYGERFVRFISSLTKSSDPTEKEKDASTVPDGLPLSPRGPSTDPSTQETNLPPISESSTSLGPLPTR